MLINIMD